MLFPVSEKNSGPKSDRKINYFWYAAFGLDIRMLRGIPAAYLFKKSGCGEPRANTFIQKKR